MLGKAPKPIETLTMRVTMSDRTQWDIPVMVIARDRAERYKHEFDDDLEKSIAEDTKPLFEANTFDIADWASNNMDWNDVKRFAVQVPNSEPPDYAIDWINGEKEFV